MSKMTFFGQFDTFEPVFGILNPLKWFKTQERIHALAQKAIEGYINIFIISQKVIQKTSAAILTSKLRF